MSEFTELKDGIIEIDSKAGKEFGFTSDKFNWGSYLWKQGNRIIVSFIHSKIQGKGYLSGLFKAIESKGFKIAVPTPFANMTAILKRKGFKQTWEYSEQMGESVEVWLK